MIVIGIDPGLTGGISCVSTTGDIVIVEDLPTCANGTEGSMQNWLDCATLIERLQQWSSLFQFARDSVSVIVERQVANASRPGGRSAPAQTIASQFDTFGALRGALCCFTWGRAPAFVTPQRWKKFYGLKGGEANKGQSRELAARLYPDTAPRLQRVKDHNRAEALLIAHYGRSTLA